MVMMRMETGERAYDKSKGARVTRVVRGSQRVG